MEIIGMACTIEKFKTYLVGLKFTTWKPSLVVVHHCAAPSLAQRPQGFQPVHMQNLRSYYGAELGWSAGPHLFIDEHAIWLFSTMEKRGVHAKSFNATGIGIEMLGDYDSEDPMTGRGLEVCMMTARAVAALLDRLRLDESAIRFHREDPKTSKTCPGKKVKKDWFVDLVKSVR
jgi:hypothetical protein